MKSRGSHWIGIEICITRNFVNGHLIQKEWVGGTLDQCFVSIMNARDHRSCPHTDSNTQSQVNKRAEIKWCALLLNCLVAELSKLMDELLNPLLEQTHHTTYSLLLHATVAISIREQLTPSSLQGFWSFNSPTLQLGEKQGEEEELCNIRVCTHIYHKHPTPPSYL